MSRLALSIILTLVAGALALIACTQPTNTSAPGAVPVTVEVTREQAVVQTVVATVQIPVEVTREVFIEVTPQAEAGTQLGSPERPIQLVFSPRYGVEVTTLRATNLVDALAAETGLTLRALVPNSHAEAIAAACSDPTRTIAFLTVLEYVLAADQCNLQIGFAGVRGGIPWSAGMLMVRTTDDPPIRALTDLDDRTWGLANPDDLATGLYFRALFASQGIAPAEPTVYETDNSAVIAAADAEVDFVTATFLPPILPYDDRLWEYGVDDPELWRRTGEMPYRSGIGFVVVVDYVENGGYRVRDARASVLDARGQIFADTTILALSPPIPDDAIAFGAQMPLALVRTLNAALVAHTATPSCVESLCSTDFFGWEGVATADEALYEAIRFTLQELELSSQDVLSLLDK